MSTGNFQMELEGEGERAYGMSLVCIPVNSNKWEMDNKTRREHGTSGGP